MYERSVIYSNCIDKDESKIFQNQKYFRIKNISES